MKLKQEVERLQGQKRELLSCASVGNQGVASLKERVWELEANALEQEKIHSQQENTIKQLEQVRRPCSGDVLPRECAALDGVLSQGGGMKIHRAALLLFLSSLWLPRDPRGKPGTCRSPTPQLSLCCRPYWPHQH